MLELKVVFRTPLRLWSFFFFQFYRARPRNVETVFKFCLICVPMKKAKNKFPWNRHMTWKGPEICLLLWHVIGSHHCLETQSLNNTNERCSSDMLHQNKSCLSHALPVGFRLTTLQFLIQVKTFLVLQCIVNMIYQQASYAILITLRSYQLSLFSLFLAIGSLLKRYFFISAPVPSWE